MKKTNLLLSLMLASMVFALPSFSQIAIDRDDFPRKASFIDTVARALPGAAALPTEGADQYWDYSNLVQEELAFIEYNSAEGDPHFSDAFNYRTREFFFFQFPLPFDEYDGLDEEGWYSKGRNFAEVNYSISGITGGPDDTIRFTAGPDFFDGRMNMLKFPVAYQNQWSENHVENFNFELSVAGFGLNDAPGNLTRYFSQEREVVGYGQLVIPNFDGSPGAPMDALLIKVYRQAIDSVFMMGELAPPALMNAFGLTQGEMASESFYVFYRPHFGSAVLNIDMNPSVSVFYRPQANDVITSINEPPAIGTQVFPNPVSAGQRLVIETEHTIPSGYISINDITGREVYQQQFASDAGNQIQTEIPNHLRPGIYVYTLQNSMGKKIGTGKLQVK